MRVLFVCTANISRSRTAEELFHALTWNLPSRGRHEARSAGTHAEAGSRALTREDLEWADVVCVMETRHEVHIRERWPLAATKVRVLDVPDVYMPGEPVLKDLLATHILSLLAEDQPRRPPSGQAGQAG